MWPSWYESLNTWPLLCTWVLVRRDVALCRRTEEVSGLVFTSLSRVTLDPARFRLSSGQRIDNAGQETDDAT